MKVLAPAKVNLHLEVLGLREDGFHELAMVMQSIALYDELTLQKKEDGLIKLFSNDTDLSTGKDNLIVRAAELLKNKTSLNHLGVEIFLEKNIPIGAGLAGGSSDAAATLVALNKLWKLKFSNTELEILSRNLGSDVPFCISGGTQICFGRGEILEPINQTNNELAVLLLKDPFVNVSTPWAYKRCKEVKGTSYLKDESQFELFRQKLRKSSWLKHLSALNPPPLLNDLQDVVLPITPAVKRALELLSTIPNSIALSMSGSGPSCFAIFPSIEQANKALETYRSKIESEGLQAWTCTFLSNGVTFGNE